MKFSGEIGFWKEDVEVKPGVWKPEIIERHYTGDVLRSQRRFQGSSDQNETFTISNRISIIADLYSRTNWDSIRYVLWKGTKWKVTDLEEEYPRLTLSLGGVWNENEGRSTEQPGGDM